MTDTESYFDLNAASWKYLCI